MDFEPVAEVGARFAGGWGLESRGASDVGRVSLSRTFQVIVKGHHWSMGYMIPSESSDWQLPLRELVRLDGERIFCVARPWSFVGL